MNNKQLWTWTVNGPWIDGPRETQWNWKEEDETVYVKFQGSVENEDWFDNFDFLVRPYRDMPETWFVHRGFLKRWKLVQKEVLNIVDHFPDHKIVITGFSHGAAIALLAHEDIRFSRPDRKIESFTYGGPRVVGLFGSCKIKDRFSTLTRYAIGRDLVTHVPFVVMLFTHVGNVEKLKGKYPIWKFAKNHLSYGEFL